MTASSTAAARERPRFRGPLAVLEVAWRSIAPLVAERRGVVLLSTLAVLALWGSHGRLELLGSVWAGWRGPGSDPAARPVLIPGVPWDHELVSFWAGAVLLVAVPALIVRLGFREPLAAYGLGLPPRGRRTFAAWSFVVLAALALPAFWAGAGDPAVRAVYPIFRGSLTGWQFVLYELSYLPFFLAIEFVFRGYLLFGLARTAGERSETDPPADELPGWPLLIQMLPYTAWHLGKPPAELWGTFLWGLVAGAAIYRARSVWPVVGCHWLLNVFMDGAILWRR